MLPLLPQGEGTVIRVLMLLVVSFWASVTVALTETEVFGIYEHLHQQSPNAHAHLDAQKQKLLFQWVAHHPVTSLTQLGKYDPQGIIGFCFGRSMAAHLMARKMQLNRASIRKLFVVGDLRSGKEPEWRFHNTLLVLGQDRRWYAIDPVMSYPIGPGGPVEVNQWMDIVQTVWDKHNKAKFYLTSVHAILPDVRRDPHGTTGEFLIETGFDPSGKAGFKPMQVGSRTLYQTTADGEDQHFISVRGKPRFRFDGLAVGGQWIDYNGYFFDLMDDLYHVRPSALSRRRSVPPTLPKGVSLYGMKLNKAWGR